MAERYGFFNSVNGDRIYDASDVAGFIKKFFTNGVFNNSLEVSSNDNMTVNVATGSANIEGYSYELDEEITLDIEEADSTLSRIDSVILRLDLTNRQITIMLLTGSYATNPSQPSITRSGKIYDLRLANISIPANSTRITTDMISDTRFSSDCGNVTQAVLSLDTDEIFKQYDTTFKNLFAQMTNLLDSDTAGTLQNEINSLSKEINENTENEWKVVEISDEELKKYTQKEGYLVNEKNKTFFDGKIPHLEKKGEVVKLATFDNANFTTKTVEDLKEFKILIWQCCYRGQPQRILGSVVGTLEQFQQCDKSGLTWQTTFPGNVNEFMCELYYKNDTEIISRVTGQYAMGVLYGIRK